MTFIRATVLLVAALCIAGPATARSLIVRNRSSEIVTYIRVGDAFWLGRLLPGHAVQIADLQHCLYDEHANGTRNSKWSGRIDVCNGRTVDWIWNIH